MTKRKRSSGPSPASRKRTRKGIVAKMSSSSQRNGSQRSMSQSKANARYQSKKLLGDPSRNPFPDVMSTTFTYPIDTFVINSGAVADESIIFKLNSIYDFDYSNVIGNTQPDYMDQLISATGPYRDYMVKGWRLKATVDNLTGFGGDAAAPLHVILGQGYLAAADCNTYTKMKHLPNTQHAQLAWYGQPPTRTVMEINGKSTDYVPARIEDQSLVGNVGGDPVTVIYGALAWSSPTYAVNTEAPTVSVMIHCEFDVDLYLGDGTAS